jgi:GMP synthase-like glutamine amidotransferase
MRILAIKNAKNEKLEYIEDIFESRNLEFDYLMAKKLDKDDIEDLLRNYTHIVILGGPQGVYEADKYPYLRTEMELIQAATSLKKPILGICLGAQLIAASFGAQVYPFEKEVGWYEVKNLGFESMPKKLIVFQWHQDTFDLPERAKLLFTSKIVKNQGFVIESTLALQFHLEVKKETVRNWLRNEKSLDDKEKEKIVEETDKYIKELNRNTETIVQKFLNAEF